MSFFDDIGDFFEDVGEGIGDALGSVGKIALPFAGAALGGALGGPVGMGIGAFVGSSLTGAPPLQAAGAGLGAFAGSKLLGGSDLFGIGNETIDLGIGPLQVNQLIGAGLGGAAGYFLGGSDFDTDTDEWDDFSSDYQSRNQPAAPYDIMTEPTGAEQDISGLTYGREPERRFFA